MPSRALGLWACTHLQGCHMDSVTGSLFLGRFFFSLDPTVGQLFLFNFTSPDRTLALHGYLALTCHWLLQGHERTESVRVPRGKLIRTSGCPPGRGSAMRLKTLHLVRSHACLVISHHRSSSQISAGFIRFGHGTIE